MPLTNAERQARWRRRQRARRDNDLAALAAIERRARLDELRRKLAEALALAVALVETEAP
jgi:hypothetical protein